ncbi:MAG: hypothetical protein M5U34_44230 [Chloroflexi bacterium]|nr:hypothetical protein [Chloroflexota bacterium]
MRDEEGNPIALVVDPTAVLKSRPLVKPPILPRQKNRAVPSWFP